MTEVKTAAGADMPGELGSEMIGFVNNSNRSAPIFRNDCKHRKTYDHAGSQDHFPWPRPSLSVEADAGAPHQSRLTPTIRHGDDDALRAAAGGQR